MAARLGRAEGVLGCAPAGLPKSGPASVGGARQWCGRLGQVDHCPGAGSLGDVAGAGPTLVAMRLSRPNAWTPDKARLDKAGGPTAHRGYRARPPLAWDMWPARGTRLPQGWSAGDDEMGRPDGCRRRLHGLGER